MRWALLNNVIGNNNTAVGWEADIDCGISCEQIDIENATALGNGAKATASNSIVLGNASISKTYAHVTTITGISDRRRKKDIRALDANLGLDFIEKLKLVSYRYNTGDETERL